MEYKVIISLTRAKTRRVGAIVSILEDKGLELVEIQKSFSARETLFSCLYRDIFKSDLKDQEAMDFYRRKFSPEVLERKLDYLFENNVEMTFESEKALGPNEIWEYIVEKLYHDNLKKLPLMFVLGSRKTHGYALVEFAY